MLDELSVTNLGIIESARVEPGPGMVVVTGETGTGKTLLLGALRLLAGAPARSSLIGPHGAETTVEGRLLLDGEELIVTRRVHSRGSRSYINGKMVPARVLAERMDGSMEIVSQHDPLSLTRPNTLRALIDLQLDSPDRVNAYRSAWKRARVLEADAERLGGDLRALERELDLLTYQIGEIDGAGFHIGEDEELARLAQKLGNAEEIQDLLAGARRDLASARDLVGPAVGAVRRVGDLDPAQGTLVEMIEGLDTFITEALATVREEWEAADTDPRALASVNERLAVLGDMRRKYGAGIEEILAFGDSARVRRQEVEGLLERAATIDADRAIAARRLEESGERSP